MNNSDSDCPNRLDWLAFCYASGDLDPAETAQFEAQLADDQSAREALARAVELTQTVAAAESQCDDQKSAGYVTPAARIRSDWNSRVSWMAVGGLASLLVALLWSGVIGPTWRTARQNYSAAAQQHLAFAWTQTRHELADAKDTGLWPTAELASEMEGELASDFTDSEMEIDETPSWLTAAVLGQAEESPEVDSFGETLEN